MGKEEVLRILKRRRQATLKELSEVLEVRMHNVWESLMRLVKEGEVERIIIDSKDAEKYGLGRGGRNHILWKLKEK